MKSKTSLHAKTMRVEKKIKKWYIKLFMSHRIAPVDLGGKSGGN